MKMAARVDRNYSKNSSAVSGYVSPERKCGLSVEEFNIFPTRILNLHFFCLCGWLSSMNEYL